MNPRSPAFSACKEDIDAFFTGAKAAPLLGVDTETTVGGDVRDGRDYAMGVSVAYRLPGLGLVSNYFPFRHKNGPNLDRSILTQLKDLIDNHPHISCHHLKFDLVSLGTLGIKPNGRTDCTLVMAHMINENEPFGGYSLDNVSKYYLNDPGKKKNPEFVGAIKAFGWNWIPSYLMHEYAAYDSELHLRLREHLELEWDAQDLEQLWENESAFIKLLVKMEGRGVRINQALVEAELTRGQSRMGELTEQLGLNPASPKDLARLLIEELGLPIVKYTNGSYVDGAKRTILKPENERKPSFDKQAMEFYEELLASSGDARASLILEYRGYQKTVSSNYKPYRELLSPDGRLRPNYKMHGTVTGRMSCELPNLQQIPRVSDKPWNGRLKQAFIAEDGFTLWEADYSQLELRLAAAYAKEEGLLAVFNTGRDVFDEMASDLGMARHDVKTLTYTIQYGGGVTRISNVFGVNTSEAQEIKDGYFRRYPGFKLMSQNASNLCKRQGFLRLWSKRRRHFTNPQNEAHKAFNSVIQGGAAEIVKHSMLRLGRGVDNDSDCRMLLQVHDSVVFEIRNGKEMDYLPRIKELMEGVEPDFGVHFAVDIHKWGTDESWSLDQSQTQQLQKTPAAK